MGKEGEVDLLRVRQARSAIGPRELSGPSSPRLAHIPSGWQSTQRFPCPTAPIMWWLSLQESWLVLDPPKHKQAGRKALEVQARKKALAPPPSSGVIEGWGKPLQPQAMPTCAQVTASTLLGPWSSIWVPHSGLTLPSDRKLGFRVYLTTLRKTPIKFW